MRASWQSKWYGIDNASLVTDDVVIQGYIVRGTSASNQNIVIDGIGNTLTIQDTLHIHGNLSITNGADMVIEAGGILIINGDYYQSANSTTLNNGVVISTGAITIDGTGNVINNATVYTDPASGYGTSSRSLTDLYTDNASLHDFALGNIISNTCKISNTGSMFMSGTVQEIYRWESSIDFFETDIQSIANTTSTLTYGGLFKTTSYRVFYRDASGVDQYSTYGTVLIKSDPVGGQISGPLAICKGDGATLTLSNHSGSVASWAWSTDDFASDTQTITTDEEAITLTPTQDIWVLASVTNDYCAEELSAKYFLKVEELNTGTLSGPANVCEGTAATYTLSGYNGNVVRWEWSTDGFATIQSAASTSASYTLTLNQPTEVRAVIEGTVCPEATSNTVKTTISSQPVGGALSGLYAACEGDAVTYTLSGYSGTIVRWESSTDNFASDITTISNTSNQHTATLSSSASFRVVLGNEPCSEVTSSVITTVVSSKPVGGTVSGSQIICQGETASYRLLSYLGDITHWEWSTDGFISDINTVASTNNSISLSPVQNIEVRAWVANGSCAAASSASLATQVDMPSAGGSISGNAIVCTGSTQVYALTSYTGNVLRWESSADGFVSDITTIASTSAGLSIVINNDIELRAVVQNGSCPEVNSATFSVQADAVPVGGLLSGPASVCEGTNSGTINLSSFSGSIVKWQQSTDNFASDIQDVNITSASLSFSALVSTTQYRAVVENGSCGSVFSEVHEVKVEAAPVSGSVSGPTLVCEGANFSLSLSGYSGTIVKWQQSADNFAADITDINTTDAVLTVNSALASLSYRAVVASASVCSQVQTAPFQVNVEKIVSGMLTTDQTICEGSQPASLNLVGFSGNILRYESSTDGFVADITSIAATTNSLQPGILNQTRQYRAVIGGAVCAEVYSNAITITIEPALVGGSISGPAQVCDDVAEISYNLSGQNSTIARWEISTDNFIADIQQINTTDASIAIAPLSTDFWVRAVVSSAVCGEGYSTHFAATVVPASNGGTISGSTVVVSGNNSGILQLQGYSGSIQYWQSSTDNFASQLTTINETSDQLAYLNLAQTTYYRAVVTNGSCTSAYSAVGRVTINHAPITQNDTIQINTQAYSSVVNLLLNDSDVDGDVLQLLPKLNYTTYQGGTISLHEDGTFWYDAPDYFFGTDSVHYTVCDNVSGATLCANAVLVLEVSLNGLRVYEGISPNGDGLNEVWVIENIERYPDNKVWLYDRYGNLVFEQEGYSNTDNHFMGVANKGINASGKKLPDGTYFYKISLGEGLGDLVQGFLVIKAE